MITLENLEYQKGTKKNKKRVGRGKGSGWGKTAGKGHKGQKARSGYKRRFGFEGGQTPLYRRLPKVGFTNIFKKDYVLITLDWLNQLSESVVDIDVYLKHKKIKNNKQLIKVLSNGKLTKKLVVQCHKCSKSARAQIEKLGGKVELLA